MGDFNEVIIVRLVEITSDDFFVEAFARLDGSAVAVFGHLRAAQAETGSCQLTRCWIAKGGTSYKVVLIPIWTEFYSFVFF